GLTTGKDAFGAVVETERLTFDGHLRRQLRIEKALTHFAEAAVQEELIAFAQIERGAARVRQRDHAEKDLVRELVDVERRGDGESDVVQRLELPQSIFELKVAFARLLHEAVIGDDDAEKRLGGVHELEIGFSDVAVGDE